MRLFFLKNLEQKIAIKCMQKIVAIIWENVIPGLI